MRNVRSAIVLFSALTVSVPAFAASRASDPPKTAAATHSTAAAVSTHATKGTIKSVDANTLVIARSPKSKQAMRFELNPSTQRQGNLAVGSTVEVRYRTEANKKIATVVSVQTQKKQA
jgi:hypothetical protein